MERLTRVLRWLLRHCRLFGHLSVRIWKWLRRVCILLLRRLLTLPCCGRSTRQPGAGLGNMLSWLLC